MNENTNEEEILQKIEREKTISRKRKTISRKRKTIR